MQDDPWAELKQFITVLAEAEGAAAVTDQTPQQCDLCGKIRELRPYGPNGEHVCYDCGMADPEAAKVQWEARQ